MSSEDKRIIEQTASTTIPDDAFFIFDSALLGTFKISQSALLDFFGNATITEVTKAQYDALPDTKLTDGVLYAIKDQETSYVVDIEVNGSSILDEDGIAELAAVATSGEAEDVSYDNTTSGLTATNVQDAIDETTNKIDEIEIPVKDVQVKTDSTYDSVVDASGNAKIDLSSVTAYGEVPNLPQAIATFKDGADAPMKSLKVAIEPQQDLHGYDAPWVGGAGKNKLPMTISSVKANNTEGTWSGNNYTQNGVTFSLITDNGENITSIKVSGTASANTYLYIATNLQNIIPHDGTMVLSGCSGGSSTTYALQVYFESGFADCFDDDRFIQASTATKQIVIVARNGYAIPSGGITFYPMIRLATETDSTFAPYSNICPISGWDEVDVTRTGKNLFDATNLINDRTIDTNGDLSGYGGRVATLDYIPVKPNTSICLSYSKTVSQNVVFIYALYKDGTLISRVANNPMGAVIQTENANQIKFAFYDSVSASDLYNIQLEYGNTATSYEPYNPNSTTYTIDLDGTRYGGELDVVNGDGTDRLGFVDLGDLNFVYYENNKRFAVQLNDGKPSGSGFGLNTALCECYPVVTSQYGSMTDGSISIGSNFFSGSTCALVIHDENYTDATLLKASLSGKKVVYELATPLTIQLTPTAVKSLLGSNNVWADTGDITDCVYRRDMSSTIDDIIARLEALEG